MFLKPLISLTLTVLVSFVSAQNIGNLLYHEAADSPTIFNTYVTKQTGTTYGIKPTKWHYFNGIQSARFELRDTDPEVQSGTRAEITFPTAANLNRWYSYAVYFPGMDYEYDDNDEVITQWHQGGGLTPALCVRTMKDSMYVRIVKDVTGGAQDTWINLGVIEKNVWRSYVFHVIHSSTESGLIEIWKNNTKILNRAGKNMYPVTGEVNNPNWKLGVYKSAWNGSGTTDTDRRVILFDDIKMGNENASHREMCPNSFY